MAANLVKKHPSRIPLIIFNGAENKLDFTDIKYVLLYFYELSCMDFNMNN